MIGEHLQGYDTQQGRQEIQGLGHLDNPVGNGGQWREPARRPR